MTPLSNLEALFGLYADRGGALYGEAVSQTQHALQCACLAEADGAPASLIVAALLHDVGHLLETEANATDVDGRHEIVGAHALKGLFGEAVRKPIAMHVGAKRYLCFKEAAYLQALSPASKASLTAQGGPLTEAEATAFERRPYWREAIALRRYDDQGKQALQAERSITDFAPLMRALLIGGTDPRRQLGGLG
jgi:phosphonate degradation associated HDIG domain protein